MMDNAFTEIKAKIDEARMLMLGLVEPLMPKQDRLQIQAILAYAGHKLANGRMADDLRSIVELDEILGGESDLLECQQYLRHWHEDRMMV